MTPTSTRPATPEPRYARWYASVIGNTAVYVSGGAEHQGPPGAGRSRSSRGPSARPSAPASGRAGCADATGFLTLVYFNVKGDYLHACCRSAPSGSSAARSSSTAACRRCAHPDLVVRPDEVDRLKPIEPVYPLTAGLSPRIAAKGRRRRRSSARRTCRNGSTRRLRERRGWPGWGEAVAPCPCPAERGRSVARDRRRANGSPMTRSSPASSRWRWSAPGAGAGRAGRIGRVRAACRRPPRPALGFALTGAQRLALAEIAADMARAAADDAAAAGRCRQRQDRRRAAGDADRGRERRARRR